jgi:hypothetical protein
MWEARLSLRARYHLHRPRIGSMQWLLSFFYGEGQHRTAWQNEAGVLGRYVAVETVLGYSPLPCGVSFTGPE